MNTLFQNILTASFHGSIVILAVMLLRLVLKKTPRKYICLLWLLAGLRLLMPFQIQSDLSLQPSADPVAQVQQQISRSQTPAAPEDFSPADLDVPAPVQTPEALPDIQTPVTTVISSTPSPAPETAPEPDTGFDFLSVLPWFWLGIACCFGIYSLYTYLTLKLKVREAVKIPGGWECDRIETAFILGFIRPNIYIPMGMTPEEQRYILAHERTHLDKGDHWFKMVGFLALALHWFNPLVWAAYILLCKDIEIACDERVVQFMELDERKAYSAALLNCSTNRAHFAACPVAFGEVSVKERIKSVISYKKPGFWISLVGVIAIVFVAVCLVTSPARKDAAAAGDTEPTSASDAVSVHNVDELLAAIAPDTVIQLEPGTYNVKSMKSASEILKAMVDKRIAKWDELGVPAGSDRERVMIIASIAEAEVNKADYYGKVTRGIENRLEQGMSLGMDSTVAYGNNVKPAQVTTEMTQDESNPYNTYKISGLPPTPISNPGDNAIQAALHPEGGNWLYFCTVNLDTGETKFAATADEHDQNVAELRKWQAENQ